MFRGWAACAKVAFRLRETRGLSSPVVTPLRNCTLAPRPLRLWSRNGRTGRLCLASATRQSPASWCPSPPELRDCEDTDRSGVRLAEMLSLSFVLRRSKNFTSSAAIRMPPSVPTNPYLALRESTDRTEVLFHYSIHNYTGGQGLLQAL
ncbi:hypothetical protein DPMN_057159 [Dreissena polymorpha]|uniref:Uncharacterized protein n=1 Tax=Dreissena polymorpha TaxID=45954 RepID=A0A9D4CVS0_DREPO|nr:hypothetical protein DPMN_057159 [Dreissena polymorpha]